MRSEYASFKNLTRLALEELVLVLQLIANCIFIFNKNAMFSTHDYSFVKAGG